MTAIGLENDFRDLGIGCAVKDKGNVEYCCEAGPCFFNGCQSCFLGLFLVSLFLFKAALFGFFQDREMK